MSDDNQPTPPKPTPPKPAPPAAPAPPSPTAGGVDKKTQAVNLPPKKETSRIPTKTQRVSLSAKPQSKTSAIPLRKETVRITLKSSPAERAATGGGEAPAPKSMAAPTPPAPAAPGTAPKAPAVAPTIPLGKAGAPAAAAPTVQLKKGGAPAPAAPGAATQELPQATVKLKQTQPLSAPPSAVSPSSAVNVSSVAAHEEESDTMGIAIAAVILVLMGLVCLFEFTKGKVSEVDNVQILEKGWTEVMGQ